MAGWFSRRSGSRVSIQNPVRRVLQALSLSRNPMPPRTTRKSDRRKVSDRTMVGTAQPVCLSASGIKRRRYESTMNLRKRKIHRGSFQYGGWTARPFSLCLAVAGEEFVLTSPFIERDYRNVRAQTPEELISRLLSRAPSFLESRAEANESKRKASGRWVRCSNRMALQLRMRKSRSRGL